ncbi:hypothetical protein WN51_05682 [Melipona quadrifasciata]|uniref:Uncharacterized protein n=1 Tax=Melipona quadrifasciata TaxID=166423 RepID=A0A0M9AB83_9HYME|nr:hypothetical protein WN51_05682 [Melipona quadrifasciata]
MTLIRFLRGVDKITDEILKFWSARSIKLNVGSSGFPSKEQTRRATEVSRMTSGSKSRLKLCYDPLENTCRRRDEQFWNDQTISSSFVSLLRSYLRDGRFVYERSGPEKNISSNSALRVTLMSSKWLKRRRTDDFLSVYIHTPFMVGRR